MTDKKRYCTAKVEIRVMQSQAKKCGQPLEPGRSKKWILSQVLKNAGLPNTLNGGQEY